MNTTKEERFKRLAQLRANRILKDLKLLGNLSNRNNYAFSEQDTKVIFNAIKDELRTTEMKFENKERKRITL